MVGVENFPGPWGWRDGKLVTWKAECSRNEADNLWLGLNSFLLWFFLEKKKSEGEQQTQTPPFRVIYPYDQAFFTSCNNPLPGPPSGTPASGV